jgi:hypothetical protein
MSKNLTDPLRDLFLTSAADLSQLERALAEIPVAAEIVARSMSDAINAAAPRSAVSLNASNVTLPDVRPTPSLTLRPEVLDALIPANPRTPELKDLRRTAQWAKIDQKLKSGNLLTILVDRNGTITQKKYASEPTKADKAEAKKCFKDALDVANEAFTGQPPVEKRNVKKASAAKQRNAKRAKVRTEWLDERHPGWSLVDWREHTGAAYETLRNYRDGITTTQTRSVRAKLAKAEAVEFSIIPK